MEVSKQIIEVLDTLAQRFGIAIDWSQKNAVPYIQQLCSKYITYEIATSILWICFGVICIIAGCVFLKLAIKYHKEHRKEWGYEGFGTLLLSIATGILFVIGASLILARTEDIVKCIVFPELQILEFIKSQTAKIT